MHNLHKTIIIMALLLALVGSASAADFGNQWTQITSSADWSARNFFGAISHDGYMWIMGGYTETSTPREYDVWRSSDGETWTEITSSAGWTGRSGHEALSHDGYMWVIGGYTGSARKNDVWRSSDGETWTEITSSAGWTGRLGHEALSHDGYMWVLGGDAGSTAGSNDVWRSSNGNQWTQITSSADWIARREHIALSHDGYMWVMGGVSGSTYKNDVWRSSDGETWTEITSSADWSPRRGSSAISVGDSIILVGGDIGSARKNDVWRSSDGETWTEITSSAGWTGRFGHEALFHDGYMWVMGGYTGSSLLRDVWRTDVSLQPLAQFSADPTVGYSPLIVQFEDLSSGLTPTTWVWDYNSGDGWIQFSTAQSPEYTFGGGIYDIRLTVSANGYSDNLTKTDYIAVVGGVDPTPTPTATPAPGSPGTYFTASPRFGDAPLNVTFTDRSTGSPSSWIWEYRTSGETTWDEISTSQNPIITFETEGRYDIQLTATNEHGNATYARTGYIRVGESGYGLNWDPELGIWTKDWWDSSASIPDPASLWGGITAPLTALIGSLLYVWIWLVLVAGAWLYTGETTTPYVIGLLSGSALAGTAQLVGQDGGIMMMIVMGFAGAGVLAKVIAGRG